jgi:hypothetical protein
MAIVDRFGSLMRRDVRTLAAATTLLALVPSGCGSGATDPTIARDDLAPIVTSTQASAGVPHDVTHPGSVDSIAIAGPGSGSALSTQSVPAPTPSGASGALQPESQTTSSAAPTLAVHVQPGTRYLVDDNGEPFLMLGDAAWSLIAELDRDEIDEYITSRRGLGFNTILVSLIEHRFSSDPPNDAAGDPPFTTPGDFSTPNEAYFEWADWVLQRLSDAGFIVLLTPDYAGWDGGDEGWWQEMSSSGTEALNQYGRFVGNRYAHLNNIIWVNGGDYAPPDSRLFQFVQRGIAETDPGALQTAHLVPDNPPRTYWAGASWLDLDNIYTYGPVADAAMSAYRESSLPYFLIESAYENEHDTSTQDLRTQAYQAVLTGAMGHVFGNNPIWHFSGPGLFDAPLTWQEALNESGSTSMAAIARFMTSIDWWKLEPDIDGKFLVDGVDSGRKRIAAALADDRTWGVAYLPTTRRIAVNLGELRGVGAHLTWYDPSTGQAAWETDIDDDGIVDLEPPESNASKDDDWILVLTGA